MPFLCDSDGNDGAHKDVRRCVHNTFAHAHGSKRRQNMLCRQTVAGRSVERSLMLINWRYCLAFVHGHVVLCMRVKVLITMCAATTDAVDEFVCVRVNKFDGGLLYLIYHYKYL